MVVLGSATTSGTTERPVAGGDEMVAMMTMTTMARGADMVDTMAVAMPQRI
jgi:hypothetical protein